MSNVGEVSRVGWHGACDQVAGVLPVVRHVRHREHVFQVQGIVTLQVSRQSQVTLDAHLAEVEPARQRGVVVAQVCEELWHARGLEALKGQRIGRPVKRHFGGPDVQRVVAHRNGVDARGGFGARVCVRGIVRAVRVKLSLPLCVQKPHERAVRLAHGEQRGVRGLTGPVKVLAPTVVDKQLVGGPVLRGDGKHCGGRRVGLARARLDLHDAPSHQGEVVVLRYVQAVLARRQVSEARKVRGDGLPGLVDRLVLGLPVVDQAQLCAAGAPVKEEPREGARVLRGLVAAHDEVADAAPSGPVAHNQCGILGVLFVVRDVSSHVVELVGYDVVFASVVKVVPAFEGVSIRDQCVDILGNHGAALRRRRIEVSRLDFSRV